jgi:hypothetical protein
VDQSHVRHQTRGVNKTGSGTPGTGRREYRSNQDSYDDDLYDDEWPARLPNSTRRYRSDVRTDIGRPTADVQANSQDRISYAGRRASVPARRTAEVPAVMPANRRRTPAQPEETDDIITRRSGDLHTRARRKQSGSSPHWLVFVGIAMFIMVIGWMLFTSLMGWWTIAHDDLVYGRPRTYQTDAVVGHNDSVRNPSHFIALNMNRHIEVIEFPGGDATKAKVYIGPVLIGPGQDLAPVTLTFQDVNGDGKPDMIINVQGSRFVFINDNGQFRPLRPGEHVQF